MVKRVIQVDDIAGVGSGQTAIINLPIGPRYHDVTLVAGGGADLTLATTITNISIKLGAKEQRRITAARLDALNTLNGAAYAAQTYGADTAEKVHLPIFFGEPWRKRGTDQDALAWQTGWLGNKGTFQILVDFATVTTASLTAFATVDDFDSGKPHGIMKYYSYDFGAPGGTSQTITTLDRKDFYSQISVFPPSDSYVNNMRLKVGGVELYNLSDYENVTRLKSRGMNPTAVGDGVAYHLVFDADDQLEDVLPAEGASSMVLDVTWNEIQDSSFGIVTQRLGLPD